MPHNGDTIQAVSPPSPIQQTMPTPETVIYSKCGAVSLIRLNRPRVHNAFNTAMRDHLFASLEAARDDPETGAILISGAGESFCAGADLTEFGSAPSIVDAREARWNRDLWGLFLGFPKPIVASIHGHCIGSGLEMALLCDLRLATADASFAMPEVHLGLIPAAGGTQTIPRIIGAGRSLHLLLSGQPINAQQALKYGLISRLTSPEEFQPQALALAERLAALDGKAVAALKTAVNHGAQTSLAQGLQLESRLISKLALSRARQTL